MASTKTKPVQKAALLSSFFIGKKEHSSHAAKKEYKRMSIKETTQITRQLNAIYKAAHLLQEHFVDKKVSFVGEVSTVAIIFRQLILCTSVALIIAEAHTCFSRCLRQENKFTGYSNQNGWDDLSEITSNR